MCRQSLLGAVLAVFIVCFVITAALAASLWPLFDGAQPAATGSSLASVTVDMSTTCSQRKPGHLNSGKEACSGAAVSAPAKDLELDCGR